MKLAVQIGFGIVIGYLLITILNVFILIPFAKWLAGVPGAY